MGRIKEFYHEEICNGQIDDIGYEEEKMLIEDYERELIEIPLWTQNMYK